MTTTALHSDYVLPAAGWYEHSEIKWVTPLMPFIHAGEKATTFFEAKSDWELISRLTEALDLRAKQRGEPVIFIGNEDADARGIADGAQVRVFNDLDELQVMAKVSPMLIASQPGHTDRDTRVEVERVV
jgi:anaerobic selenocysteine-containing dehydrogenase